LRNQEALQLSPPFWADTTALPPASVLALSCVGGMLIWGILCKGFIIGFEGAVSQSLVSCDPLPRICFSCFSSTGAKGKCLKREPRRDPGSSFSKESLT